MYEITGFKIPNPNQRAVSEPAIVGGTDGDGNFHFMAVDADGHQIVMSIPNPFIAIDREYLYNPDHTVAQIIETGLGQTKTTIYTWSNGVLQSKAVILT